MATRTVLGLSGLLVVASSAAAQQLSISDTVPIYCRDDSGEYQPFVRTNYGRLKLAFERQFGFEHTLQSTSPTQGRMYFRGGKQDSEVIYYVVEVHRNGIALLHMRVLLEGATENLTGTEMCWRTFGIVNLK